MSYTVDEFLVVETIADVGGPVSQAVLDDGGASRSFASLPYPGETVITGPGLVAASGGPGLPPYPLEVSAEHPFRAAQEFADPTGAYSLRAEATAMKAEGLGRNTFGGDAPVSQSSSFATTELSNGAVEARAQSIVEGVTAGDGVLRLGRVRSLSRTVLSPEAATPVTTTELVVEGATVNGVGVTLGPEGLEMAGSGAPLPKELTTALADAGVSVRWVKGAPVAGGGAADGIQVTREGTVPVPGEPQDVSVLSVGGVVSYVRAGDDLGPPAGPADADVGIDAPADPTTVSGPEVGESPAAVASVGRTETLGAASDPIAPGARGLSPVNVVRDLGGSTKFFYLVIAVGAVLLMLSSSLWRTGGVRVQWPY